MATTNEIPKVRELEPLVLSRTFAASRDLVFRAWSSADHVKHWFCPADYSIPEARVEFRVGGAFEVCMRSASGQEHWTKGKFTEIVPSSRLVIDMEVPDAEGRVLFRALTVVTFTALESGCTRLDVAQTYTVLEPAALAMIKGARQGWGQTLDRLESELEHGHRTDGTARSIAHGTFTLERTYKASRAQVFRALTHLEAKAEWFGGGSGQTILAREMDVRPGGREHVSGRWESGVVSTFDAVYHEVVADERVIYSYEMRLDDRKISVSLTIFELKPAGTGTRLVMTEHGAFLDGYDDAGSRERGSNFLLEQLGRYLDG
jgi:uncharacterized protein YndB with AHSA1/START domain